MGDSKMMSGEENAQRTKSNESTSSAGNKQNTTTRKIRLEGLKTQQAYIGGHATYYDRRHNREGEPHYPENMKTMGPAQDLDLEVKDCDLGSNPMIGASHAYVDQSTSDNNGRGRNKEEKSPNERDEDEIDLSKSQQWGRREGILLISLIIALLSVLLYHLSKIMF